MYSLANCLIVLLEASYIVSINAWVYSTSSPAKYYQMLRSNNNIIVKAILPVAR